jgi:hypothetical protein
MKILLTFLENHLPRIIINILFLNLMLPLFKVFQLLFKYSFQVSLYYFVLVKISRLGLRTRFKKKENTLLILRNVVTYNINAQVLEK